MSDFDKSAYWKLKTGKSEHKRALRQLEKQRGIVAVHNSPDWPKKIPGTKSLAAAKREAQRALIVQLNGQLFAMDHPQLRHKPVRQNCYYCQEPKIFKNGVCAGHYDFLYKGMSNKQRMMEKANHRKQRAQELQRKREELRKERDQVTA